MTNISIIICTYNRFSLLKETIESLLNILQGKNDWEILIIDNNSSDGTSAIKDNCIEYTSVKYFLETSQGLSNARNRGIKEAKGDILVFFDDDIDIDHNYFTILNKLFEDDSINIVGGKVLPYKVDIPSWLPPKFNYLVSVFDLGDDIKYVDKVMGANYAMRRNVADQVGLYNPDLGRNGTLLFGGEEVDYLKRAANIGFKTLYHPELVVFHKINEKLTTKYVYEYSQKLGMSEYKMDKGRRSIKLFEKLIKSVAAMLLYNVYGRHSSNERKKAFFGINNSYAIGYIKSFSSK